MQCLYQRVEAAVNSCDPMALLAMAAPSDEYEAEILEITELLRHHTSVTKHSKPEEVASAIKTASLIVMFVFELYFYQGCLYPHIAEAVAKKIFDSSIDVRQPRHRVQWFA